jgi:histidinol-phosphatase (PHP family)
MLQRNYHTHTYRCQHATGDVIDYAKAAIEAGLTTLGMSDHAALPDNRWNNVRMSMPELDDYEEAIELARKDCPDLTILKGMECEYVEEFHSYLEDELLGVRGFDYLIGAGHYTPFEGGWLNSFEELNKAAHLRAYASFLGKIMSTGLFAFIAHPDIFGCSNDKWNDDLTECSHDILQAAVETGIPLEINGLGLRKIPKQTSEGPRPQYPWIPFWEIAQEYPIKVICNSDAHHPKDVAGKLDETEQLARRFNLNLLEELPI